MAIAYESGPEGVIEANGVERKLKAKFKKELNLTHFQEGWKAERSRLKTQPGPRKLKQESDLPEIIITSRQLREVTADAMAALSKANSPPHLFLRSGILVHVIRDEGGRPSVAQATESRLRGNLSRSANYMRINQFGELKGAFPPVDIVRDMSAINPKHLPFPALTSVVEVPTLRKDGSVIYKPGYDSASAVYYAPAPNLKTLPVPDKPTQADAARARAMIDDAIGEFPYADEASKANVYGLLLTPVMRPAIDGCTPLAVVDAPQAGTGKSLLIDVLSIITTGRPSAMVPYPYKEEEMVKQLGASIAAGRQLIAFDNLEGELRSPALALALTAKEYEARILGVSRNMTVPNVSTWVVTGNNIRPAGDMPRRCYQIRLNAKNAKPYSSRDFKHPNLTEWVLEHRSELLNALLVLARFWYTSGQKTVVTQAIGSFEDWHRKVAGIIANARIPGFLTNYADFIDQEDESPRQWEEWLDYLHKAFDESFTIADLMLHINSVANAKVKDILPAEVADVLEKKVNHRIVIGKMFRSRRERVFGEGDKSYWLEREEPPENSEHKGAARWIVRRPGESLKSRKADSPEIPNPDMLLSE